MQKRTFAVCADEWKPVEPPFGIGAIPTRTVLLLGFWFPAFSRVGLGWGKGRHITHKSHLNRDFPMLK